MPFFLKLMGYPAFHFTEFMKSHEMPANEFAFRLEAYLQGEARLGRIDGKYLLGAVKLLINAVHNIAIMESREAGDTETITRQIVAMINCLWNSLQPANSLRAADKRKHINDRFGM
jgi:hypothetical protein